MEMDSDDGDSTGNRMIVERKRIREDAPPGRFHKCHVVDGQMAERFGQMELGNDESCGVRSIVCRRGSDVNELPEKRGNVWARIQRSLEEEAQGEKAARRDIDLLTVRESNSLKKNQG